MKSLLLAVIFAAISFNSLASAETIIECKDKNNSSTQEKMRFIIDNESREAELHAVNDSGNVVIGTNCPVSAIGDGDDPFYVTCNADIEDLGHVSNRFYIYGKKSTLDLSILEEDVELHVGRVELKCTEK